MANCNCPKPTALTPITATTCPEEIGQIQRVWFVRKGFVFWDTVDPVTGGSLPVSIQPNLPTASAGWTTLKGLSDDNKVVFPPLFGGDIVIEAGEAITQGGNDNSTLSGKTFHIAFAPSTFGARYDQLTATQTLELKALICEELEVYLINSDGAIIGNRVVGSDLWTGIAVDNVALGGRSVQGFAVKDSNLMSFQLDADWDTTFEKQIPVAPFNPLTF
jgi:hypothetical protein